ncbi:DUF6083 domain-containing protein [Streptomyces sp. SID9727]|uniref:DUF6083 domain-containing protein n=1 Tax=Streptomyces sp. SID9727 TaxID=2706114 RepID=UPI0013C80C1A|nr:DUF6083 domain-containing protein [Streptomyces sp. SID9727]NEC63426.1 hypothetical protein [Streptomyces sp. SID9727]
MSMYLHRSAKTKVLRKAGASRCKYCNTPIEWFERYDALRIPLTTEFPTRRIPSKMRWHVEHGIAYPGTDASNGYCRIPHPAICPAFDHPDLPPDIHELVRVLAVRMRVAIENGEFIPYVEPATQEEVENPEPEGTQAVRHVIAYSGMLRIGPCAIEDLQCIGRDGQTGQRCENAVCDLSEGSWEPVSIDEDQVAGRLGQAVLSLTGGIIWAWQVADFNIALRWWKQRCPEHHNSSEPDHVPNEFVPFHPLRHDAYVLTERPTGYDLISETRGGVVIHDGPTTRTTCATPSCSNTSLLAYPDTWLCWQCEKRERYRHRVHQRWVKLAATAEPTGSTP